MTNTYEQVECTNSRFKGNRTLIFGKTFSEENGRAVPYTCWLSPGSKPEDYRGVIIAVNRVNDSIISNNDDAPLSPVLYNWEIERLTPSQLVNSIKRRMQPVTPTAINISDSIRNASPKQLAKLLESGEKGKTK